MLKILVDENIMYANHLFNNTGKVVPFKGRALSKSDLMSADALIIRSVTKIDSSLLDGTPIKFIGSITSGIDHVDKQFLTKSGIKFVSTPGCNAIAVAEYVFSALLFLAERDNFQLTDRTVGIVGVGHIGKQLKKILEVWGVKTFLCDPPRQDRGDNEDFLSLKSLIKKVDIITLHTPLYINNPYKTLYLINKSIISNLKKNSILINTARGAVMNNLELLETLKLRQDIKVIMDVWESEPNISIELLKRIDIGTAHIAGSTLESKVNSIMTIFQLWNEFINKSKKITLKSFQPLKKFNKINFNDLLNQKNLKNLINLVHNICYDDMSLRKISSASNTFDKIRNCYTPRREWSSLKLICTDKFTAKKLNSLGFQSVWKN